MRLTLKHCGELCDEPTRSRELPCAPFTYYILGNAGDLEDSVVIAARLRRCWSVQAVVQDGVTDVVIAKTVVTVEE